MDSVVDEEKMHFLVYFTAHSNAVGFGTEQ